MRRPIDPGPRARQGFSAILGRAVADTDRGSRRADRRVRARPPPVRRRGLDHRHSIAAADADGKLGPRLDTLDEDAEDVTESIAEPREDAADGYSGKLMPTDYSQRLDDAEIRALAAFVAAAWRAEGEDGDDDSGRGPQPRPRRARLSTWRAPRPAVRNA